MMFLIALITLSCNNVSIKVPVEVTFHTESLKRVGIEGDNRCTTLAKDGSLITSMCDGSRLGSD